MSTREIDEDERREAIDDRRAVLRGQQCQCGGDLAGSCPGPANCPLAQDDAPPMECGA